MNITQMQYDNAITTVVDWCIENKGDQIKALQGTRYDKHWEVLIRRDFDRVLKERRPELTTEELHVKEMSGV